MQAQSVIVLKEIADMVLDGHLKFTEGDSVHMLERENCRKRAARAGLQQSALRQ